MTILSLPGGIYPNAAQWSLEHNVGGGQNPLGNTLQRIQRDGGRWRADLTFPTFDQDKGALFAAYLDKASRGDMWTYITPPHADARGNWGPDELVVNGSITQGVTGWLAGSGAAINANARRLRVKVGGSPGAVATAQQTLTTETDQPHVVMVDLVKGSTANWRVRLLAGATEEHVSYYEDEGRVVFTHIPGSTSTILELACNSTTEQDYTYFANASVARCLLVNDSLAVGNECDVKGGPPLRDGALKAGEFVTIQLWNGWQMVRLTEDLDTDSSGNGTLRFEPSLRDGVKGGGAVIVHKPFCRMIVPAHASPHAVDMPRLFGFSVSYLEDVTEIGIAENPQDTDLIWYWDAHSYSLAPSVGTGTPTLSNSGKTYFDQSGTLKTAALDPDATGSPTSYLPAFDHDPVTGALRGQLIEAAGTNLLLWSGEFSQSVWQKTNCSISANAVVGPGGSAVMDGIVEDSASGAHRIFQDVTFSAGQSYTMRVFLQRGVRGYCQLAFTSSFFQNPGCIFNLDTGAIQSAGNVTASIAAVGGGIYLCTMTAMATSGGAGFAFINPSSDGSSVSYAGDSGAVAVYGWGAQLEAGAFPTSYIPTTSATASRSADVDTLALNKIPGFTASEYTVTGEVLLDVVEAAASGSGREAVSIDDGTTNERTIVRILPGESDFNSLVQDGGVTQADMDGGAVMAGAGYRCAVGAKANDFAFSTLGDAPTVDTSGTMPAPTTLRIGSDVSATVMLNGHSRRLSIHKTKKPLRQIRSLSA